MCIASVACPSGSNLKEHQHKFASTLTQHAAPCLEPEVVRRSPGPPVTWKTSTGSGRITKQSGRWPSQRTGFLSLTRGKRNLSSSASRIVSGTCMWWRLCFREWLRIPHIRCHTLSKLPGRTLVHLSGTFFLNHSTPTPLKKYKPLCTTDTNHTVVQQLSIFFCCVSFVSLHVIHPWFKIVFTLFLGFYYFFCLARHGRPKIKLFRHKLHLVPQKDKLKLDAWTVKSMLSFIKMKTHKKLGSVESWFWTAFLSFQLAFCLDRHSTGIDMMCFVVRPTCIEINRRCGNGV